MPEPLRIFIASSTESLHVAEAMQSLLSEFGEVTCWPEAFNVARYYIDDLREAAGTHDFAIFVFTPDDDVTSRGDVGGAPRDNVVFEMGMFCSQMGPRRVFVLKPDGHATKVPSDLAGISYATYRPPPAPPYDARWEAALRPAARKIRGAVELAQHGRSSNGEGGYLGVDRIHSSFPDEEFTRRVRRARVVTVLNTWMPNLPVLIPALADALGAGGEVQVLLLNPYSLAARTRASTLGRVPGQEPPYSIAGEIKDCFRQLELMARKLDYTPLLRVDVYPEIPAMPIYRADDYYLAGLFLRFRLAVAGPQLEISQAKSVMAAVVANELGAVAESSKGPVDLRCWQDWLNGNV